MTAAETPVLATCECGDDPALQLLRDLILHDVDQYDASLIAFGHAPRTTAPAWVHRTWARLEVRRIGNKVRADLGLPELPVRFEKSDLPLSVLQTVDVERFTRGLRNLARVLAEFTSTPRQEATAALTRALAAPVQPFQVSFPTQRQPVER